MFNFPINYNEPLYRPPSEAKSLIIQVTLGCSYNKCTFCEMYTSKKFKTRLETDIFNDIEAFIPYKESIRKVFLADGDPLVLSTKRLLAILNKLHATFPKLQRVSTYATPTNILKKTPEELRELRLAGLKLLYVGIESGDDEVLQQINKGETQKTIIEGLLKTTAAKIDSSVMIIIGAGGKELSEQHAINSAKVLNYIQPKYASTLVLTFHKGLEHFKKRINGDFNQLNPIEIFNEMKLIIEHLKLNETIFRSDHISNNLVLKGVLGKDKNKFLAQIAETIKCSDTNLTLKNNRGF